MSPGAQLSVLWQPVLPLTDRAVPTGIQLNTSHDFILISFTFTDTGVALRTGVKGKGWGSKGDTISQKDVINSLIERSD